MIYFSGKKEKIKENLTLKIKKILEKTYKKTKKHLNMNRSKIGKIRKNRKKRSYSTPKDSLKNMLKKINKQRRIFMSIAKVKQPKG